MLMTTMKMTTTLTVLLVLQSTMAVALSLGMYKSCLYECLNCVNTWGKDLFNGEDCAENCALSGGRSIDRTCASFFSRSSRGSRGGRHFLHSDNPKGFLRSRTRTFSEGQLGYRSYRPRGYPVSGSIRSLLSSDCQRLCRTCEAQFTSRMDAHSCRYTCVRTNKQVVAC